MVLAISVEFCLLGGGGGVKHMIRDIACYIFDVVLNMVT